MSTNKQAKGDQARELLKAFWGPTGSIKSADILREKLLGLKLGKSQYEDLRDDLSVAGGGGTTGQRVLTADRVLERLAR